MAEEAIEKFSGLKRIAVFGASDDPASQGYQAIQHLSENGYHPLPINPRISEINTTRCFGNLDELPTPAEGAVIVLEPEAAAEVMKSCALHKVQVAWLQPGAESREAGEVAARNGIALITNRCICKHFEAGS